MCWKWCSSWLRWSGANRQEVPLETWQSEGTGDRTGGARDSSFLQEWDQRPEYLPHAQLIINAKLSLFPWFWSLLPLCCTFDWRIDHFSFMSFSTNARYISNELSTYCLISNKGITTTTTKDLPEYQRESYFGKVDFCLVLGGRVLLCCPN